MMYEFGMEFAINKVKGGLDVKDSVALILASHGEFSKAALASAEMIVGEISNVRTLGLFPGVNLAGFETKLESNYQQLSHAKGTIIICDIFGGTPSNAAAAMLIRHRHEPIAAYAGLNMAVLLELASNREASFEQMNALIQSTQPLYWRKLGNDPVASGKEEDL